MVSYGETELMSDECIAIITARGGSTRVPRKNVRPFCGRPMVAWPTRAACVSGLFSRVIISTDNEEIAAAAMQEGAERPYVRPPELADAHSTTTQVLRHDLAEIKNQTGRLPAFCCCLYGTSAMVTPKILTQALDMLRRPDIELVMAVIRYGHPIERALQFDAAGKLRYRQPEFVPVRTQDIAPSYHDAGLLYFFNVRAFMEGDGTFLPLTKTAIEVSAREIVDIDTEEDWDMAETLAKQKGLA